MKKAVRKKHHTCGYYAASTGGGFTRGLAKKRLYESYDCYNPEIIDSRLFPIREVKQPNRSFYRVARLHDIATGDTLKTVKRDLDNICADCNFYKSKTAGKIPFLTFYQEDLLGRALKSGYCRTLDRHDLAKIAKKFRMPLDALESEVQKIMANMVVEMLQRYF